MRTSNISSVLSLLVALRVQSMINTKQKSKKLLDSLQDYSGRRRRKTSEGRMFPRRRDRLHIPALSTTSIPSDKKDTNACQLASHQVRRSLSLKRASTHLRESGSSVIIALRMIIIVLLCSIHPFIHDLYRINVACRNVVVLTISGRGSCV